MEVGKCPLCGGETDKKMVETQEYINGRLYIIDNVEAEVCRQCGERMYSGQELEKIETLREKISKNQAKPIEIRKVEVLSAIGS